MGRFNVEEIGTGTNIHPKANLDDAIDSGGSIRQKQFLRSRVGDTTVSSYAELFLSDAAATHHLDQCAI